MAITFPISEMAQRSTDAEEAAMPVRGPEPINNPDAEEELMEMLWAADPGNQGA